MAHNKPPQNSLADSSTTKTSDSRVASPKLQETSQVSSANAHRSEVTIRFREGDPAQIMYFANIFSLAHDTFELFIVAAGYSWEEWFQTKDYMIPIRNTEADFKIPFRPGRTYQVSTRVLSFGESSFTMFYEFTSEQGTHATVRMVHACLDQKTKQKISLPTLMRTRLEAFHG